jgi:anti-anti-sigma factor
MEIVARRVGQVLVVSVEGSIDALTAVDFADFLTAQLDQGQKQFVLDLDKVDFMSSAGLRGILHLLRESRQRGGDVCLAAVQPGVRKTLEIAGLWRIVENCPSVDEAVASFES